MIDPVERELWFREYFAAARKAAPDRPLPRLEKWARSMSLIAEQFVDNDDREPTEELEAA